MNEARTRVKIYKPRDAAGWSYLARGNPHAITSHPTPDSVSGCQRIQPNPQRLIIEMVGDDYIVLRHIACHPFRAPRVMGSQTGSQATRTQTYASQHIDSQRVPRDASSIRHCVDVNERTLFRRCVPRRRAP
jgi:hypothetical protein